MLPARKCLYYAQISITISAWNTCTKIIIGMSEQSSARVQAKSVRPINLHDRERPMNNAELAKGMWACTI